MTYDPYGSGVQFHGKAMWELTSLRPDMKAVQPCTHTALFHKLKEKLKEWKIRVFSLNCEFLVRTQKNQGNVFTVESFHWLSCMRPFISSCLGGGHLTKFLLTEFRQAGWESIWLSVTKQGSRCARFAGHNLEPNIISSSPPTQLMITYYFISIFVWYY